MALESQWRVSDNSVSGTTVILSRKIGYSDYRMADSQDPYGPNRNNSQFTSAGGRRRARQPMITVCSSVKASIGCAPPTRPSPLSEPARPPNGRWLSQ